MDLSKNFQCVICGWKGKRTNIHHIIPKSNYGEDCVENLIELCPNHHAEATEDEEAFTDKYNLVGVEYSKDKIDSIKKVLDYIIKNTKNKNEEIASLYREHNFDWIDCMAYCLGITRRSIMKTYLKDKQDELIYRGVED